MAKIIPYRPFFYSERYRDQIGQLVSPPYDVISPTGLKALRNQSPYNSVQLCVAENPDDSDRYQKMKECFAQWKESGVFETAKAPIFCLIEERFDSRGADRIRIGFTGLLESTPFEEKQVLPHEHTLSGPKADRLELLKTLGAELSQVFLCYKDSSLMIEQIHKKYSSTPPRFEGMDPQGVKRRVWFIENENEIRDLQSLISTRSLLIADGHHRYETSVHFRKWDGTPKSQYVQGYFTNLDSPGFSILPIHRIFQLPEDLSPSSFQRRLEQIYEVSEFKQSLHLDALMRSRQEDKISFLCALRDPDRVYRLDRKKTSPDDAEIFSIHKNIFEDILGWDVTKLAKGVIQYEHETEDFKKTLSNISRGVGLFLPPTDLNLVMQLAERGERMPQKSTFFFPKLASGLINYELGSY